MKIILLTVLTTGGVLCTARPVLNQGTGLQGKWKIARAPTDWKIAPGTNINVTGSDIQIRLGPVKGSTFNYSADYTARTIDAQKAGEKPRLGKFELSGETVTIAVGEPGAARPESVSSNRSGITRWVFRRIP